MRQDSLEDPLLAEAIRRYGISAETLQPLPGGNFTRVYEFRRGGASFVLRLTPPDPDLDPAAFRSILAWTSFLAQGGACVPQPVPSPAGRLIESLPWEGHELVMAVYEKAPGVLAEDLPIERWDRRLIRALGAAAGRLHALARSYEPEPGLRRPDWDRLANCYNPQRASTDPSLAPILAQRAQVVDRLGFLPHEPSGWGLIHADLHGGNLLVEPDLRRITILDFDDCCYGWFGMDIAMSLLDMLVLYPGDDREAFARRFLEHYLAGYLSECPLTAFWAAQIPRFLKLLEIGLYLQVWELYDPQDRGSWVGRFMPGRRARIEAGQPFIDIDFVQLLGRLQWS